MESDRDFKKRIYGNFIWDTVCSHWEDYKVLSKAFKFVGKSKEKEVEGKALDSHRADEPA